MRPSCHYLHSVYIQSLSTQLSESSFSKYDKAVSEVNDRCLVIRVPHEISSFLKRKENKIKEIIKYEAQ